MIRNGWKVLLPQDFLTPFSGKYKRTESHVKTLEPYIKSNSFHDGWVGGGRGYKVKLVGVSEVNTTRIHLFLQILLFFSSILFVKRSKAISNGEHAKWNTDNYFSLVQLPQYVFKVC